MHLLDIATTDTVVTGACTMHTIIDDEDGKPLVVKVRACIGMVYAQKTARCSSLLYGGLARLAVYDENGHLDSVYLSGERVVSRCD